jgi:hypothetical protein
LITSGVSRSGSTVMKITCSLSPSAPSSCLTLAARIKAVGQTSGHWTKPKYISTALPL